MFVSKDLVFGPGIEHGKLSTVQGDLIELVREPARGSLTTQALETFLKRPHDRFGLGFTGQSGNLVDKTLRFAVSDVECHGPFLVTLSISKQKRQLIPLRSSPKTQCPNEVSYTARVEVSDALPGADLIRKGLSDLAGGVESIEALLVLVGAPRLRRIGFDVPDDTPFLPEDRLYAMLSAEDSDSAHSRYNALIRRLVSFERAAECVKP
jgi:hypothetical protein